jgi:HK97 family phage major capsid protein
MKYSPDPNGTEERQKEIRARLLELGRVRARRPLEDADQAEFDALKLEHAANDDRIIERRAALRNIARAAQRGSLEEPEGVKPALSSSHFHSQAQREALRAIDRLATHGEIPERGLLRLDEVVRRDRGGAESAYVAAAADPDYLSAFGKIMAHGRDSVKLILSDKERDAVFRMQEAESEQRALGIGSGPIGGFAVPITIDPTVIPTSSGAVNSLRQVARVETIAGTEWRGVTSAGVTAAYTAEATEASDGSPVLAQPVAYAEKARAFTKYSLEIGGDWEGLARELGTLFADAKDQLEATKFVAGVGHSSFEPEGLHTGATAIVSTAAATLVAVGDVYSVKAALPPRYQPRATWLGSAPAFDKVRRLVGAGNTTEMPVWQDSPPEILRKQALENTGMPATFTSGASVLTYGDFTQFLILDRVGMSIEQIPHMFGTAANLPTGERGAYCWWRSSSKCLSWTAFRSLKLT